MLKKKSIFSARTGRSVIQFYNKLAAVYWLPMFWPRRRPGTHGHALAIYEWPYCSFLSCVKEYRHGFRTLYFVIQVKDDKYFNALFRFDSLNRQMFFRLLKAVETFSCLHQSNSISSVWPCCVFHGFFDKSSDCRVITV